MNKMRKGILLALALLFTLFLKSQNLETQKSKVNFSISNMKWNTVEGTFTGMKGEIDFKETDLTSSSFKVCIDAASINTGNNKRDKHLRTEDFFYIEKYPEICFTSTSISKTSDGFVTKGTLKMHGVSKEIAMNFIFQDGTFSGKLSVNRFDFKVGEDSGTFTVGEVVNIEIIAVIN